MCGRGAARGGAGDGNVRGAGGGGAARGEGAGGDSDATRERTAAGAGERRLGERERKLRFELDPRAVIVCTNLKHWKVSWKKSCGRWIGFLRLAASKARGLPLTRAWIPDPP